jgi:hypothetical protein
MRIDSSGNVGINKTSPATKLNIGFTGADAVNTFRIEGSNGSSERYAFDIQADGANTVTKFLIGSGGGAPTERMRIDSNGNLLVGATSTYVGEKFNVTTAANQKNALFNNTNASYTELILNLRGSRNTTNGTWGFLQCSRDGVADVLYIYDSGNVVNANNSYGAISDAKLKENIVDASPKLDKLNQVRVVNYNLKTQPEQNLLGVVAQELEQIFPGMVEETNDRDADGNLLETTTKSVKYSVFVPMLIKAIQELNAKVDAQAVRIAELEGAK